MATIADLIMAQGRHLAEAKQRQGSRWVPLVQQLSQLPGQISADRAAAAEAARQQQAEAAKADLERRRVAATEADNTLARDKFTAERTTATETKDAETKGRQTVLSWLDQHGPQLQPGEADRIRAVIDMPGGLKVAMDTLTKAPEPFTLKQGDVRFDASGKELARVAQPIEPERPDARALNIQLADAIKRGDMPAASAIRRAIRESAEAGRDPNAGAASEPLIAVIGDDGQPVMLPRSKAEGRRPASTREQGRPVTSGDAGRIADLDTSLNDLATLKTTVTGNKATGTLAKVGAMAPNAVTELTGFGADAKSKQAVIDRVKQVIGKSLEEGVLRKEDEIKYERILPTIGDVASVVATKLAGLERAITQRRQTTLDALADAGYDITKFQARAPRTGAPTPQADPLGIR